MKKVNGYNYEVVNANNEVKRFHSKFNKVKACEEQGLVAKDWKVVNKTIAYTTEGLYSRITKAQMLKILEDMEDDEVLAIEVQEFLGDTDYTYEENDGLCYDKATKTFRAFL
jgi:hypothetical protein